jgi:Fe-S cluster assembly protein SufD
VRSNDVKAAHGCNIERISDDKLFYMRSRGVPKEDALKLMIGSYFERVFSELRVKKSDFVEEIFAKFEALI